VSECLVCQEVAGEFPVPGGLLWADEHAVGFHIPPVEGNERPYLGHLLVVTRRHVDHLGDLTDAEAASVQRASRQLGAALRAEGIERVHLAVIGLGIAHFHQHVYPRYPGVPEGTNWMRVDQLPGAPHGGAAEIDELGARLRRRLQAQQAG
jgi:diadenosine tetraphosphate (Ap4A) HIT family hydrolase